MKNIVFLTIFLFTVTAIKAQDYKLSFSGTGSATAVDSVKVENLTQGTSLTMAGTDILNLKGVAGIGDPVSQGSRLTCYPNPTADEAFLLFQATRKGTATITIADIGGRIQARSEFVIGAGTQRFSIGGLGEGLYLVRVNGEGYSFKARLTCTGSTKGSPRIVRVDGGEIADNNPGPGTKSGGDRAASVVIMQYNNGDVIKFTGKTGIYQTVTVFVPTQDKTVSFSFIPCTDGSSINYPVLHIGTQTWMAANLKTTSLTGGGSLQNITDPTAWATTTQPACCRYQNDNQYTTTYGMLYNGYAALSGNLCPSGWHVPSDAEWTILEIFLQNHGYNYDGTVDTDQDRFTNNKTAKSLAGNSLWDFGADTGAVGNDLSRNNLSGFSAYAGGYRFETGNYDYLDMYAFWWTSTEISGSTLYRAIYMSDCDVKRNMLNNKYGFSVRCIQN